MEPGSLKPKDAVELFECDSSVPPTEGGDVHVLRYENCLIFHGSIRPTTKRRTSTL